jgi:hypothetical protein
MRSYIVSEKAKHFACSNQWATRSEMFRFHSHNTYNVVLVKEAKLLASTQPMGNKKRNVSLPFPQHIYMYNIRCVSQRSETSRFHTDNGQQEAKCFASIPTTHIYVQYTLC